MPARRFAGVSDHGELELCLVGDRGDLASDRPADHHRGDLPDHQDSPGDHRPGGRDRWPADRGQVQPRGGHRGGAERARHRSAVARGRSAQGHARGSRRHHRRAVRRRPGHPPRPALHGGNCPAVLPASPAAPVQGGLKGCWAPAAAQARATLRQLWPSDFIPGESAQLLPTPRHFSQLAPLVTDDLVTAPAGPDPKPYLETLSSFEQAGFNEVYLQQVGGNLEGAFESFATQVLPRARGN